MTTPAVVAPSAPVETPAPSTPQSLDELLSSPESFIAQPEPPVADPGTVGLETEGLPAAESPLPSDEVAPETPAGETPDVEGQAVEIPHFRPDQAPINLTGVPQEAADAMRRQIKTAARVPTLEKQVSQGADAVAKLRFLNEQPLEALHLIAENNRQVGEGFVRSFLEMNPDFALQCIDSLNLQKVQDDPDYGQMRAKAAKYEANERARQGRERLNQSTSQEAFITRAGQVGEEIMTMAGVDGQTLTGKVFQAEVDQVLATEFKKNPGATSDELLLACQPLLQEAIKLRAPMAQPKTLAVQQPRDAQGKFTEKQQRTQQLGKAQSGQTVLPSVAAERSVAKGMTLEQSLAAIGGNLSPG